MTKKVGTRNLYRKIFWEEEARAILQMLISASGRAEKLIWEHAANGEFSVKSAYFIALNLKMENRGEGSNKEAQCRMWKNIWQLSIPNKVKNFLWRASTNTAPTNHNLRSKRAIDNGTCPICTQRDGGIFAMEL